MLHRILKFGPCIIHAKTTADNNQSFLVSRMSHYMDVQMQAGVSCMAVCFENTGLVSLTYDVLK